MSISTNKSSTKLRVIRNGTALRCSAVVFMQHNFPVGHFFWQQLKCGTKWRNVLRTRSRWRGALEQGFVAYFSFLLISLQWKSLQDYSKLSPIIFSTKDCKKTPQNHLQTAGLILGLWIGQISAGEQNLVLWILRLCSFLLSVHQIWPKM